MLMFIFVIAALALVGWAFYLHSTAKPDDPSVFKKIMLSVTGAIASAAAGIATYFSSSAPIP